MMFLQIEMSVAYPVGHNPPKTQERHNSKVSTECNFSHQAQSSTLWSAEEFPRLFQGQALDYAKIAELPILYTCTQLTSFANAVIDFTTSKWPSSLSSHNESLEFGIAMVIIFPEVNNLLLLKPIYTKKL